MALALNPTRTIYLPSLSCRWWTTTATAVVVTRCLLSRSRGTPFLVEWPCFAFSIMTLTTPPCGRHLHLLLCAASAASALLVMNHHHHHHWRRHHNNCGKGTGCGCGALGCGWTGSTVQGGCCRRRRNRAVLLVLLLLLLITTQRSMKSPLNCGLVT